MCDGCLSNSERLCGYCDDYTCEKLEGFFGMAPHARATLDGIHASLAA